MAIADFAAYKSKIQKPHQRASLIKNFLATAPIGRPITSWILPDEAGTTPSTAAVPARDAVGAFRQLNGTSQRIVACECASGSRDGSGRWNSFLICDRLSHQGGLSGTVTTEQTTNLPTAALTRYTSGAGVVAAIEIYSVVGLTSVNCTVKYTNQAGTANRTSPAFQLGNTNWREAGRMIIVPLQSGDTGVRSVEGVTLSATTGTAGNFGITLFKPLFLAPNVITSQPHLIDPVLAGDGAIPEVLTDACLWPILFCSSNSSANQTIRPIFAED